MSNEIDLVKSTSVDTSWDDVVIEKLIRDIPGGRSIDTTDLADSRDVIMAGHVILRDGKQYKAMETKSNGNYKDVTDLSGYEVVGVLYRTIPKDKAFGSIMTRGVVNEKAVEESGAPKYSDLSTNVKPKDALTHIEFVEH